MRNKRIIPVILSSKRREWVKHNRAAVLPRTIFKWQDGPCKISTVGNLWYFIPRWFNTRTYHLIWKIFLTYLLYLKYPLSSYVQYCTIVHGAAPYSYTRQTHEHIVYMYCNRLSGIYVKKCTLHPPVILMFSSSQCGGKGKWGKRRDGMGALEFDPARRAWFLVGITKWVQMLYPSSWSWQELEAEQPLPH
jgi:hypothetical protein